MRVLAYHRIDRRIELGVNTVSPRRFREHLRALDAYGLRDWGFQQNGALEGGFLESGRVCVTFDDGYANFAEYAFPALQEYRRGAVLFPVAGYAGRLSRWDSTLPRIRHLSWAELRELSDAGAYIGAHTMTHPFLTRLPARQAREEISASKKAVEDGIGKAVSLFAYPYGDVNRRVARMAEEAGFEAAFTMNPLPGTVGGRFALPRTAVYAFDGRRGFASKIGARGRGAWRRAARLNQFINRCSHANRLLPRFR